MVYQAETKDTITLEVSIRREEEIYQKGRKLIKRGNQLLKHLWSLIGSLARLLYAVQETSLCHIRLYTAIKSYTELYKAIHSYTLLYTAIHSYTRPYTAIHGHIRLYTAIKS